MGYVDESRKSEKTSGSLHAMHGPENFIQHRAIGGIGLKADEPLIQQFDHLFRFHEKLAEDFLQFIVHTASTIVCPASCMSRSS
jgi:hypothetical protein